MVSLELNAYWIINSISTDCCSMEYACALTALCMTVVIACINLCISVYVCL